MTKPVDSVYIHFLDYYHYQRAFRQNFAKSQDIKKEARLALRLSLLIAERVIIPVSSYFENFLCRELIKDHGSFREYGALKVSARDASIGEHIENKKAAYDEKSPSGLLKAYYLKARTGIPGYLQKPSSSTSLIRAGWAAELEKGDVRRIVDPNECLQLPRNFEAIWSSVPDLLRGRAFVPSHVHATLESCGIVINSAAGLNGLIESQYINGYVEDFRASVVNDLPVLGSNFEKNLKTFNKISFTKIIQRLTELNLTLLVDGADQEVLFAIRCSSDWDLVAKYVCGTSEADQAVKEIAGRMIAKFIERNSTGLAPARSQVAPLLFGTIRDGTSPDTLQHHAAHAGYTALQAAANLMPIVASDDRANAMSGTRNDVFAVIICAVQRELEAAKEYFPVLQEINGLRTTYKSSLGNSGATVVVLKLREMGNTEAALATQEAIRVWKPQFLIMVGIAGGFKSDQRMLGDILVADQLIAYEAAKVRADGPQLRPRAFRPSPRLVAAADELANDPAKWVYTIKEQRPDGTTGRTNPVVHIGAVFTGEKVIASELFLKDFRNVWTNAIGVEMEGAGSSLAVYTAETQPEFILIKSICDWADASKNDEWQPYAAGAAMAFARQMLLSRVSTAGSIQVEPVITEAASGMGRERNRCSGEERARICDRLYGSWMDLAEYYQISAQERRRFRAGFEMHDLWDWLAERRKLGTLPSALDVIQRSDVGSEFNCLHL